VVVGDPGIHVPAGFGMQGPPDGLGGSGVSAHGPKGMMFTIGAQSAIVAQSCSEAKTFCCIVTMSGCGFGQAVQMIMFIALMTWSGIGLHPNCCEPMLLYPGLLGNSDGGNALRWKDEQLRAKALCLRCCGSGRELMRNL
jgi:hypothetical protein